MHGSALFIYGELAWSESLQDSRVFSHKQEIFTDLVLGFSALNEGDHSCIKAILILILKPIKPHTPYIITTYVALNVAV